MQCVVDFTNRDIPRATRSMETECFASAKIYFNNPTLGSNSDTALAKDLAMYRAAYRTNSADWNDWERKLEVQLAKIKSDDYKAWNSIRIMPMDAASNTEIKSNLNQN
jgi:hypothetical protein